jgi:predicted RNA methylase
MNIATRVFATPIAPVSNAVAILSAGKTLLPFLDRGERIDAAILRAAMEQAFGASDASGAWSWKDAYEACETATVLFLRKYGRAVFSKHPAPTARLAALAKIAGLLPSHTRRSEESQALQQFSTPAALGLAALTAAGVTPIDVVLEPSAGTGLLAVFAEIAGAQLILNEFAQTRADLLSALFPTASVTRFDAAQIDDHLDSGCAPTVVMMNPPFSAMANVEGRTADAALRHIASALNRLAPGGRLVTITGANCSPEAPAWREAFVGLQQRAALVFTAVIDGAVYARHGTNFATRLTVFDKRFDKRPADDPKLFPTSRGTAPNVAALLGWVEQHVPERLPISRPAVSATGRTQPNAAPARSRRPGHAPLPRRQHAEPEVADLAYEAVDWTPPEGGHLTDAIYENYVLQSIRIPGALPHPTKLVQSAAMASVAPPKPNYRPRLPREILSGGLLSDAQLETVIYAGEAHGKFLAGSWTVDETFDVVKAAVENAEGAVRFRRGFMLGDGRSRRSAPRP